jgi:hypothetical protein
MIRVIRHTPNPQAGGSLLVVCPRLLIKYIYSNPPSATRRRAMLWWQWTPTNKGFFQLGKLYADHDVAMQCEPVRFENTAFMSLSWGGVGWRWAGWESVHLVLRILTGLEGKISTRDFERRELAGQTKVLEENRFHCQLSTTMYTGPDRWSNPGRRSGSRLLTWDTSQSWESATVSPRLEDWRRQ